MTFGQKLTAWMFTAMAGICLIGGMAVLSRG